MALGVLIVLAIIVGYFLWIGKNEVTAPEAPIRDFTGPVDAPSVQGPASAPGDFGTPVANPE